MLAKGERHESLTGAVAEMSAETQAEDSPFMIAVRKLARRGVDDG